METFTKIIAFIAGAAVIAWYALKAFGYILYWMLTIATLGLFAYLFPLKYMQVNRARRRAEKQARYNQRYGRSPDYDTQKRNEATYALAGYLYGKHRANKH